MKAESGAMRELHILLVEDSPADRLLTVSALEESLRKAEVHTVCDGEEALHYLRAQEDSETSTRPDLILLDLNLPRLGGRSLLIELKNDVELRAIPVVVLSTSENDEDVDFAYRHGASSFLTKPFDQLRFAAMMTSFGDYWARWVTLRPRPERSSTSRLRTITLDALAEASWVKPTASLDKPPTPVTKESRAAPASLERPDSTTSPLRVLLVEDSASDALLLRSSLENAFGRLGAVVSHVNRLELAARSLAERTFEVVVLDLGLPDSQGLGSLELLAKAAPETPVVVLTGNADHELGRSALRAGAQDYLIKGELNEALLERSVRYAIERNSLSSKLLGAQRLQLLGQLAGAVAHDFNNLLAIISNNLTLVEEGRTLEFEQALGEVRDAVKRGALLTRQLLSLGQARIAESGQVDLNQVVEECVRLIQPTLQGITLETSLAPGLPRLLGDRGTLEQVLMNLAANAQESMPQGGTLSISTDTTEPESDPTADPLRPAEPWLRLRVTDTGQGIEPHLLERIFEPFFTTKGDKGAAGLGLATVRGIVLEHRGRISVVSEPGRGSSFSVHLPPSPRSEPRPVTVGPLAEETPRRLLVVDDEMAILRTSKRFLERDGHEVLIASSAEEAIVVFEEQGGRIDLILTDLQMPNGMGGRELAERLRSRNHALIVVYASGYSRELINNQLKVERGVSFIEKPYSAADLRQTIKKALSNSQDSNGPRQP